MSGTQGGINQTAARGFGSAAAEYERSRPSYPAGAVETIMELCALTESSRVLDLACGTGKMTRLLADASGARLIGLDPIEPMLRQFVAILPDTPVAAGVAERIPFREQSFDACVVAQAFHWFRGDEALREIARVLRPGCVLVAIWNQRDHSSAWVSQLNALLARYEKDVMRFWEGGWRPAFDRTPHFSPVERRDFSYTQTLSQTGMIDRVLSVSFIAALPAQERDLVVKRVLEILEGDPATAGKDEIVVPYKTSLYWCRKSG